MQADAQRDGRPAECWWRPLLNAAKFGCRPLLECRADAQLGRKVNFAPGKIPPGAGAAENVYIVYQSRRRPNIVQSLVGLR